MSRRTVVFCCLFFAVLLGCDKLNFGGPKKAAPKKEAAQVQTAGAKSPVVARVNNLPITLEDLDDEISAFNAVVPADKPERKITARDKKIEYLKNEVVRRALLYQAALDRGLERKEEVIKALTKTKQELLVMELIREEAAKVEVISSEIEDYYNRFKDQLKEPDERQVREILTATEQEAKDILIQLLQGTDFATLAKERSKAPSAKNGGDLGFIKRGSKSVQFDNVAFSDTLDVGRTSSIFKGPDGYYILKLEGKRGGKEKPLADLWDDIKRGLTFIKQQERIEKLIADLSKEAKIETYEGEIK